MCLKSLVERQARYEHARDEQGLTVEEWEHANGLPPFSVYPHARSTFRSDHLGFFMYEARARAEAEAEEYRQMHCLLLLGLGYRAVSEIFDCSYKRVYDRFPNLGTRTHRYAGTKQRMKKAG